MTTTAPTTPRLIALSTELLEEETLLKAFDDAHKSINDLEKLLEASHDLLSDFEKTIIFRPDGKHVVNIDVMLDHVKVVDIAHQWLATKVKPLSDALETIMAQCESIEVRYDRTECPRCGGAIPSVEHRGEYLGAISRLDNKTQICSTCGSEEAFGGLMGTWHTLISSVIEAKYRHAHPELSSQKGA